MALEPFDHGSVATRWVGFAAAFMIILGIFHAIAGLVAILDGDLIVATREYVFRLSIVSWGWIHLIAGSVVAVAGFGIFGGARWARTTGVVVAALSIVLNFSWLPYRPVWSVIMIAFGGSVIWALTVHGRDAVGR